MTDWKRNTVRLAIAGGILVGYFGLGYTVVPELLIPLGCSGGIGDLAVGYMPNATFDIQHDDQRDSLTVTHLGSDVLPASRTDRLYVRMRDGEERTVNWTAAGGAFPVKEGDAVTITGFNDPSPGANETEIAVIWQGTWPADETPYPVYCPRHGTTANPNRVSLAKEWV